MTDHTIPVPAGLHLAVVAIDCADPLALAGFWAALLGGTVEPDPDGDATVHAPDGATTDGHLAPRLAALDSECPRWDSNPHGLSTSRF